MKTKQFFHILEIGRRGVIKNGVIENGAHFYQIKSFRILKSVQQMFQLVVPCSLQDSLNYFRLGLLAGRARMIMPNCFKNMTFMKSK